MVYVNTVQTGSESRHSRSYRKFIFISRCKDNINKGWNQLIGSPFVTFVGFPERYFCAIPYNFQPAIWVCISQRWAYNPYLFGGFFMNEIKAEIVDCMIYDFVIAIFLYTFIRVCLILIFLILFLRTDVKMMLCVNCWVSLLSIWWAGYLCSRVLRPSFRGG